MVVGCVPSVTLLQLSVVQHAVVTPFAVPALHVDEQDCDTKFAPRLDDVFV